MSLPISDNKPKSSISQDSLHRKEVVDSLSNLISSYQGSDSLTIGICGKWGSGKTSVINFVKEDLKDNKSISIIDFNPWLYSSQENLAFQLLRCLSYHFAPGWRRCLYRNSPKIHLALDVASSVLSNSGLSKMLRVFSDLVESNTDGIPLETLKSDISKRLIKSKHKIVVVIDDVDRLDSGEIRILMKLVRSVADFSNVIYVLCYDEDIVEGALSTGEYDGHDYLQKIINLPVRLPEVSSFIAADVLRNRFLETVDKTETNEYENMIFNCFSTCTLTLRDVNIISSKFNLWFEISKNNTCPIDLLALTFLEVKDSRVYNWVSKSRLRLCGVDLSVIKIPGDGKPDNPSQAYLEMNLNREYIKLLSLMFPYFKPGYYVKTDDIEYRINDAKYVNNYFLLTPSSLNITDEMVENFIRIEHPDDFHNSISSFDTYDFYEIATRASEKMKHNSDYSKELHFMSDVVLTQPFSDQKYLPVQLINPLSKIVAAYLYNLSDSEKIDYIKSSFPEKNVHKIILYGMIIDRMMGIYFLNSEDSEFSSIHRKIFDALTNNANNIEINDSLELFFLLIQVLNFDQNVAKQIFLKSKPTVEDRKLFYKDLSDCHLPSNNLSNLVGDPVYL